MAVMKTVVPPGGMPLHSRAIRKLSNFARLSAEEVSLLERIQSNKTQVKANSDLVVKPGDEENVYILQDGWAYRYKLLPDGRRLVIHFILPGDFIGLRTNWLQPAMHSVATLTEAVISPIQADRLLAASRAHSGLASALARAGANEEMMMVERLVSLGRRCAYERVAQLLLELLWRLQEVGLATERSFAMPVPQDVLADALGLSSVHLNRTLQRLRQEELISFRARRIVLHDLERLEEISGIEDTYAEQTRRLGHVQAGYPSLV